MAKNSDYWKSRMQALENIQYEKSLEYYENLKEQFRQALNGMQLDIELWYRRLAENNDISYAAAKRLLKSKELEEFKWTVEQYIQAGEENAVDQRWMKQLENASARHHISYLEAMKLQTQQYAEVLYTQFEGGITDYLTKNFAEQFYHTAFEISKGVCIGFNLARLDTKAIDTAIRKPWAMDGKNFSDRIWESKDKLVRNLHTELSQCIIRGTDPGKAISSLAKKMNVSKSQAGNLIMTEMAAISAAAQKKCFEELNVEEYEFDATLDGKTCEVCGRMDHKVFRMTDYQVGATAPPIHPRCRCDTSPYFDDWEEFGIHVQRAARDQETGKTVYVDGSLSYTEWKDQQFADEDGIRQFGKNLLAFISGEEAQKVNGLERKFSKMSGIPLDKINMFGLPYETAKAVYSAYEIVLDKYPELKGNLLSFKYNKSKKHSYASCKAYTGEITANAICSDFKTFVRHYESDVESGFHPIGTDYRSAFVHELGHALDGYMSKKGLLGVNNLENRTNVSYIVQGIVLNQLGFNEQEIKKELRCSGLEEDDVIYKFNEQKKMYIAKHVSKYAAKNEKEFFAECFAEYIMSSKPRIVSRIFGEVIDNALGR